MRRNTIFFTRGGCSQARLRFSSIEKLGDSSRKAVEHYKCLHGYSFLTYVYLATYILLLNILSHL